MSAEAIEAQRRAYRDFLATRIQRQDDSAQGRVSRLLGVGTISINNVSMGHLRSLVQGGLTDLDFSPQTQRTQRQVGAYQALIDNTHVYSDTVDMYVDSRAFDDIADFAVLNTELVDHTRPKDVRGNPVLREGGKGGRRRRKKERGW